jgi:hypothetical protein
MKSLTSVWDKNNRSASIEQRPELEVTRSEWLRQRANNKSLFQQTKLLGSSFQRTFVISPKFI